MTKTLAKKKAWTQFSLYIRLRDSLKTMNNNRQCKCITCGSIKNTRTRPVIAAGHFIPGRHNAVLFNEEMVNGQCYHCNNGLGGNWVPYEAAMIKMYGRKRVEELKKTCRGMGGKPIKYSLQDYIDIEAKYKQKVIDLGGFV